MKERQQHKAQADGRTDVLDEIRSSLEDMQKVLAEIVDQQRTILKRFVTSERRALRTAAKSVRGAPRKGTRAPKASAPKAR